MTGGIIASITQRKWRHASYENRRKMGRENFLQNNSCKANGLGLDSKHMNETQYSLINRAIYYWDWYVLKGEIDNLVAAAVFMADYRKAGGTEYVETEKHIKAHVAKLAGNPPYIKIVQPKVSREIENDIFGMSWEELERKQGGKLSL